MRALLLLLGLGLLAEPLVASAEAQGVGYIYWSQRTLDPVRRANLGGGDIRVVIEQPPQPLVREFGEIAVDGIGRSVFVIDRISDTIISASLDGESDVQVVPNGQARGNAIAVDSLNRHLYFFGLGGLRRATLDGSILATIPVSAGEDIEIDSQSGFIFVGGGNQINRTGLNGENPLTLTMLGHPPVNDIALDHIHQKIYWSEGSRSLPCCGDPTPIRPGLIRRSNYDGTQIETVFESPTISSFFVSELAIDPYAGVLYWYNPVTTRIQTGTTSGQVLNTNLVGVYLDVEGLAVYAVPEPGTLSLAVVAAALFSAVAARRNHRDRGR